MFSEMSREKIMNSKCEVRSAKWREIRSAKLGKGIVGDGAHDVPCKPSSKLCKCEMRN